MSEPDYQRGQPVWDIARHKRGLQPNGIITDIDWHEEEITVSFHDCDDWELYSFDDFLGMYTSKFGGGWWLE